VTEKPHNSSAERNTAIANIDESSIEAIKGAFGAKNRKRLIGEYFKEAGEKFSTKEAWEHVYRLLLWADQTTGLAHCYESDKCQPGRLWYSRALSFHSWASEALSASPATLAQKIDWLFRHATDDLAKEVLEGVKKAARIADRQRAPYEGRGFPAPGEDPELVSIVRDVLNRHITSEPDVATWQLLVQRIRQYLALENKRKNLVGEGFEDVLAQVVSRALPSQPIDVHTRRLLQEIPGFKRARAGKGEKPNKVDIAIVRPGMRTLVTAKWSVRADREKQFTTDFSDYIGAESDRQPFEYVFVTNEFDPARLARAAEQLAGNAFMFNYVVHINTDALKATYGNVGDDSTMRRVLDLIDRRRILSLAQWLETLKS